jgi:hypothetical protein
MTQLVNRVAFGRGGTGVHFRSSPKADLNWQPQETPFGDPLRLVVILGGDASVLVCKASQAIEIHKGEKWAACKKGAVPRKGGRPVSNPCGCSEWHGYGTDISGCSLAVPVQFVWLFAANSTT